jgi:hypothetical protein
LRERAPKAHQGASPGSGTAWARRRCVREYVPSRDGLGERIEVGLCEASWASRLGEARCGRTVAYRPGSLSEALTEHYVGPIPKRSVWRLGSCPREPPREPPDVLASPPSAGADQGWRSGLSEVGDLSGLIIKMAV